jgi:hypothetical protein
MIDRNILLKSLEKTYILIQSKNVDDILIYHATLNREIIKKFTEQSFPELENKKEDKITVFDLKNETLLDIDLESINDVTYVGLPFEVPPHYIYNPSFEGRVSQEEFLNFQESAFNDLKELKKIQTSKDVSNNIISKDLIFKYTLLKFYYNQIQENESADEIFNDTELKKFKEKFKFLEIPDQQLMTNIIEDCKEVFNININNRTLFYKKFVKDILQLKTGIVVNDLSTSDPILMEKYISCWKDLINQHAKEVIENLNKEKAIFKENNPANTVEIEEMDFVLEILNNLTNDIDFSKFKTPMELFSFWPPVLYPAPDFVLDPYKFN